MLLSESSRVPSIEEATSVIREDRAALRIGLRDAAAAAGAADLAQLRQLVRCERAELWRDFGHRNAAEWVSAELQVSNWKARRCLDAGKALAQRPRIAAALEAGSLSLDKTVELTRFATPEDEAKLLMWATSSTVKTPTRSPKLTHRALCGGTGMPASFASTDRYFSRATTHNAS